MKKMSKLQKKYFGKRHKTKRSSPMVKYRTRYVRSRSRKGGGGRGYGGGLKSMVIPVAAGVADAFINPRSPIDGIGSTVIGVFGHNEVVKNIGLYQVGQSIAQFIPFVGGGQSGALSGSSQV